MGGGWCGNHLTKSVPISDAHFTVFVRQRNDAADATCPADRFPSFDPRGEVSKHSRWAMSKSLASLEVMALQKQINDLKESAVAQRRVEMALRDAAEFARAVLDESPFPLCRLAGDGKVVYANEAMVGFLGYASRRELLDLLPILGMLLNGEQITGLCQTLPDPPGFVEAMGVFRLKDGSARPGQLRLRRGAQKPDITLAVVNDAPHEGTAA